MSCPAGLEQPLVQGRVIDGLGNPGLLDQPEIVVRGMPLGGRFNTALLGHAAWLTERVLLLPFEVLHETSNRIEEGVFVGIPAIAASNGIELFEGEEKDTDGARTVG